MCKMCKFYGEMRKFYGESGGGTSSPIHARHFPTPPCQQFFVKGNRSTSRKPTTFNRALAAQLFSHTKCYRTYRTSKVKDTLRHDEATAMLDINSKQK